MVQSHDNIIAGKPAPGAEYRDNLNPSDLDDVVGHYASANEADAERAIAVASEAFSAWSKTSPMIRAEALDRVGDLLSARRAEIGRLLSREEGKTLAEGVGEVVRAGQIFKFFAGEALRLSGEVMPSIRPGVEVEIHRKPIGVVGLITPWNFPIAIPAWKIAPALAYGNTVVFKPAELVPASAHVLVRILQEAGVPSGVVNLVAGSGRTVGTALVSHAEVAGISFTGSLPTGRAIAAQCVAEGKRIQAEMGGKNALVVLDDADLDNAVEVALNGAFFSTGQRCTASSRLIVQDGIYDRFVARLTERMQSLVVGHALDETTQIGPVVDQAQFDQNQRYLEIARGEGARVVGGEPCLGPARGYYMRPALLLDAAAAMRSTREEIFGPVASVLRAASDDELLELANDSEFGLSAGVCTTSLARARRFKHGLAVGMVMINLPTAGVDPHVPFGGIKGSSIGPREQGSYAREFYTTVRTCYVG